MHPWRVCRSKRGQLRPTGARTMHWQVTGPQRSVFWWIQHPGNRRGTIFNVDLSGYECPCYTSHPILNQQCRRKLHCNRQRAVSGTKHSYQSHTWQVLVRDAIDMRPEAAFASSLPLRMSRSSRMRAMSWVIGRSCTERSAMSTASTWQSSSATARAVLGASEENQRFEKASRSLARKLGSRSASLPWPLGSLYNWL
jgi:hypothetical protein